MKTFFLIVATSCLIPFYTMAQSINHPTIEKVQVLYKTTPTNGSQQPTGGAPEIRVQAKATITLKNNTDAVKVFLKIRNKQTNAVIYQVNYLINSAPVNGTNGLVLYKKEATNLTITNPDSFVLQPYVYEIYTEDAQSTQSIIYSIIQ